MAPLKPTHLFLGSGLWRMLGSPPWPPAFFEDVFAAAADAVRPHGGQAYWRTTTATFRQSVGRDFDGPAIPIARKHGLKVREEREESRSRRLPSSGRRHPQQAPHLPAAPVQFLDSWALTKAVPWLRLAPDGNPPYWVSGGLAGGAGRGACRRLETSSSLAAA